MQISQGLILKANKTFGFKGATNRIRIVKEGAEFWVCSSFVDHQRGIVRIAPKNKNVGYAITFATKDIEDNFNEK